LKKLRSLLEDRARLLAAVRGFFAQRGVLEVVTPVLGRAADPEPEIQPFRVAAPEGDRYLQTSPEFHMKRLLAAGSGPIYQISHAFRAGEAGRRHNPEFLLLEWYWPGFDHFRLMDEVADLVNQVLGRSLPVERIAYRKLFLEHLDLDPLAADEATLAATARRLGFDVAGLSGRDAWLELLMAMVIEPELGRGRLTFVHGYPASQAALARLDPDDPRVARRFELYLEGVELANGYHELADAAEQRARFEAHNAERRRRGLPVLPLDEALLAALAQGLPDCAGVALGLDRLLMLSRGADRLDAVLEFPWPLA